MSGEIRYRHNTSTERDVAEHLQCCDASFIPRLSARTDLPEYSHKITSKAERFEAWSTDRLVGLVAAYCNDMNTRIAYITSVSVLQEWTGKGIARRLVDDCVDHARGIGMTRIALEVFSDNLPAIRLYEGRGFSTEHTGMLSTMTRALTTTDGDNE
jgi:ribosomal protein S18 acetylase RimI-like enzyme